MSGKNKSITDLEICSKGWLEQLFSYFQIVGSINNNIADLKIRSHEWFDQLLLLLSNNEW